MDHGDTLAEGQRGSLADPTLMRSKTLAYSMSARSLPPMALNTHPAFTPSESAIPPVPTRLTIRGTFASKIILRGPFSKAIFLVSYPESNSTMKAPGGSAGRAAKGRVSNADLRVDIAVAVPISATNLSPTFVSVASTGTPCNKDFLLSNTLMDVDPMLKSKSRGLWVTSNLVDSPLISNTRTKVPSTGLESSESGFGDIGIAGC